MLAFVALPAWLDADLLAEGLQGFAAEAWVARMTGPLPANDTLALAQIESMT